MATPIVAHHLVIISRVEAKAAGLKRFFTGVPCKRGHIAERNVSSKLCLECNKRHYWANPAESLQKLRERRNKQRREDPEQRSAKRKTASEARKSALMAGALKYPATRPCSRGHMGERYANGHCVECMQLKRGEDIDARRMLERVAASTRRARKKSVGGSYTQQDIAALAERQKHRCAEPTCQRSIRSRFHIDHIVPLALGGNNGVPNLQLLCPTCNQRKSAKDPIVWARERGRLL